VITSQTPPISFPYPNIYVDWNKVDLFDVAIDGITVAADTVTIAALLTGNLPVALGSEIVGDVVGAVGVVKAGYEAYENYDSTGLASAEFGLAINKAEQRLGGGLPVVGTVYDLINLYNDLDPKITIQWTVP